MGIAAQRFYASTAVAFSCSAAAAVVSRVCLTNLLRAARNFRKLFASRYKRLRSLQSKNDLRTILNTALGRK